MLANLKEQILRTVDIVAFIGRYVKLKRNGKDWFGLCPFHSERTGSFSVDKAKGMYKCFGCGATGDVIDFVMRHVNTQLSFGQAVEFLAADSHIQTVAFKQSFKQEKRLENVNSRNAKVVPKVILTASLGQYFNNSFIRWLSILLAQERAQTVAIRNFIGTAKDGSAVFWQVDSLYRVRTAVKIAYGDDGHRIKTIPAKKVYTQQDGYYPCLYNEHMLTTQPDAIACIVESEKTAVLCSLYIPQLDGRAAVWLASSGMNGLADFKLPVLRGRDVVLCPDFSFASRATWGECMMRKKLVYDENLHRDVLKISPDGDPVLDYVPASQRILNIGAASVRIFSPLPAVQDGTDIADYLIKLPVPVDCVECGAADICFGW